MCVIKHVAKVRFAFLENLVSVRNLNFSFAFCSAVMAPISSKVTYVPLVSF